MTWNTRQLVGVIELIAEGRASLSANDVWELIGFDAVLHNPNGSMGAAFTICRRRGIIAPTRDTTTASHPARKRGIIRVWRSLAYA